jgi:DNA-binding NtrC family response regulator
VNEKDNTGVYVVLLADPDPKVHAMVSAALPEDCAFLGARTREIAIRIASKRPPSLCIVSDTMPDTTPQALVNTLLALSPAMRAMVLTESRQADKTAPLLELGTVHTKPLDPARFRDSVKNALRFCRMFASVAHLKSESINVSTWNHAPRGPRQ